MASALIKETWLLLEVKPVWWWIHQWYLYKHLFLYSDIEEVVDYDLHLLCFRCLRVMWMTAETQIMPGWKSQSLTFTWTEQARRLTISTVWWEHCYCILPLHLDDFGTVRHQVMIPHRVNIELAYLCFVIISISGGEQPWRSSVARGER